MSTRTSVERKLWEAFRCDKGVSLTATDVSRLLIDDAIRTRISNAAAGEAGGDEPLVDCIAQYRTCRTWEEFGKACCGKAEDTETPTDDFGHPLTICTGCGELAQCAGGKCWWCMVNEAEEQQ